METKAFFDMSEQDPLYEIVRGALIHHARHPDKGSKFEESIADIMHLPDGEFLQKLEERKYDVLLGFEKGDLCNYFAYQRHDDELHVFSINTVEKYRGSGLIGQFGIKFMDYARSKDAKIIQLSDGGSEDSIRLLRILAKREEKLNISVNVERYRIYLL